MADQTGIVTTPPSQVFPTLVLSGSVQQYLMQTPNNSNPDYTVIMTSTGAFLFGTSASGPWFPIAAGAPMYFRFTRNNSSFYVNGSGTLSAALFNPLLINSGDIVGLVEQIPGLIQSPVAHTYPLILSNLVPLTVNQMLIQTVSGTCTASLQINGTSITGLGSIAVTSSPQMLEASALNALGANDELTLVITSPSSPVDLSFVIQTTRT